MPRVRLRHAGRADSETFGYVHLSAGDLLREERARNAKMALSQARSGDHVIVLGEYNAITRPRVALK